MKDGEFHDREKELEFLRQRAASLSRGELIILYGRRRVGKTELVRRFLQEAGGVYLYVDYCEPRELLRLISKDVREQTGEFVEVGDWDTFFEWLSTKRVVAIDEFQRLHSVSRLALTRLQRWWDERLKSKPLMLILVGSSIGMLERVATGPSAPLYGRATSKLKLELFPYAEVRRMFRGLPERSRIEIYGIFGGTPHYLHFVDPKKPLLECVREAILERGSALFEEPPSLLRMELKEATRYNSILAAISRGKRTVKEISDTTGIEANKLTYYLECLRDWLDLVEVRKPVLGKEKMGRYYIKDHFFNFWYVHVFTNRSRLERGEVEPVVKEIERGLSTYLGPVFEDVVRELLLRYNGGSIKGYRLSFEEIGSWWDRTGNEIDLCAAGREEVLLGEVKWGEREMGREVLDALFQKAERLPRKWKKRFLLVSAGGFTEGCKRTAESEGVLCLDLTEIARLFDQLESRRPTALKPS
jgi:AAA+ ATPase superfamily predicted ATPase